MSARLVVLDEHRPRTFETMHCLWCHTEHELIHIRAERYFACPGCDEEASIPLWKWLAEHQPRKTTL